MCKSKINSEVYRLKQKVLKERKYGNLTEPVELVIFGSHFSPSKNMYVYRFALP